MTSNQWAYHYREYKKVLVSRVLVHSNILTVPSYHLKYTSAHSTPLPCTTLHPSNYLFPQSTPIHTHSLWIMMDSLSKAILTDVVKNRIYIIYLTWLLNPLSTVYSSKISYYKYIRTKHILWVPPLTHPHTPDSAQELFPLRGADCDQCSNDRGAASRTNRWRVKQDSKEDFSPYMHPSTLIFFWKKNEKQSRIKKKIVQKAERKHF